MIGVELQRSKQVITGRRETTFTPRQPSKTGRTIGVLGKQFCMPAGPPGKARLIIRGNEGPGSQ